MAIVRSVIDSDSKQADGRRWIHEMHLDQFSSEYSVMYLCPRVWDATAAMLARAAQLYADRVQGEIDANVNAVVTLGSLAEMVFKYSSAAQNIPALREAYKGATRTEAIFIGDFLNSLTDAQLRNAFNLTQNQVNSLRTNKLGPAATLAANIRSNTGA